MNRRFHLVAVFALILFIADCAPVVTDWSEAKKQPTEKIQFFPGDQEGFSHTVYTYTFPGGRTEIATGDFYTPGVSYPPIAYDASYKHIYTFMMTPMHPPRMLRLPGNGPVVMYNDNLDTIVFSPMDFFFASLIEPKKDSLAHGIEGEVESLPPGFTHRFILVKGKGVNETIQYWGKLLLADRNKRPVSRYADIGLSHLGYWTDNGAYYYYRTEPDMNAEDSLLAVMADARKRGIPYGYMQIDSWFYYKDKGWPAPGGLIRWDAMPEHFPDGLAAFSEKIGLPLITHNRWFAHNTSYKDRYSFVDDEKMSFPLEGGVFEEFAKSAKSWNVATYEQDWLMPQFWGNKYLRSGVDHTEKYMGWMSDATKKQGLTMQICMSGAAHLMDTIDRSNITTVRTSIDYYPGISKESFWPQFHINNMLAKALGIWPFKDNFRSSEDYGEAECLISILSGGMVGPSDRVGKAKAELLNRTCTSSGLLLKPDVPATPIDAMFLPHKRPFTTVTTSTREGIGTWHYLAAYHLASRHPDRRDIDWFWVPVSYDFSNIRSFFYFPSRVRNWDVDLQKDLGITGSAVAYNWRTGNAEPVADHFMMAPFTDLYDFGYYVICPVLENSIAPIGETGKFVTMADKRFTAIRAEKDAVIYELSGDPGERVTVAAFDAFRNRMLDPATVTLDAQGKGVAKVSR